MKKIIGLVGVFILITSLTINAQDKKEKLTREEKKELRAQQQEEQIKLVTLMIADTLYVLEADYLGDRKGRRVPVSSTINFISVNKDQAVFQFGSAHTAGYNGVGGATVDGTVNKYEVAKRKKGGSYFIRISISTTLGFFDITLDVGSTGHASATIHTNTRHKLNYSGKLVPLSESGIYKGMSR